MRPAVCVTPEVGRTVANMAGSDGLAEWKRRAGDESRGEPDLPKRNLGVRDPNGARHGGENLFS